MKLIECYIENFGKLHHFSHHFEEGLNVFCRENGWGKSTFAGFIKAMFYGLGTSRSADANHNERVRYLPWQGGKCGGTLTFSVGEETFRVERYFGSEKSQDTYALYNCKTGLVSTDYSEKLGEELFDIDAAGYERSTFISEHLTADVRADYTGIQAKLVDMHDLVDYQVADKALTERMEYYHAPTGGAIAATIAALASRRADLAESEVALQKTNELNRRARALDEERSRLEKELRTVLSRVDASISIRTEEALAAHKQSLEENLARTKEATATCRAYLSARIPTPAELEEQGANWRILKATKVPDAPKPPLPRALAFSLFTIGVVCMATSVILATILSPLYLLILIAGFTFLGIGVACTFSHHRAKETIRTVAASRAEYNRVAASLAAFLSQYPIVMADETLHDDGERLWAIRSKIEELQRAMRAEEDATDDYSAFYRLHPDLFSDSPKTEQNVEKDEAKREEERLTEEIDHVRDARAACEREIALYAAAAGRYTALSQEITRLEEQKKTQEKNLEILRLAHQFLTSSRNALTSRYLNTIQEHFRNYMRILTEVDRDSVFSDEYSSETYTVTPDFCVNMTKYGKTRSSDTLSRGGRDLVALCLRFAITDALFEDKKPPLILDDPFINLDDSKIGAAMALLSRVAEEKQIFYVACHSSRA